MLIQTLLMICIVLAILVSFSKQKETFVTQKKIKAYDKEHVDDYDKLVYDSIKNDHEIKFLEPILSMDSTVLDVGCGPGHHVDALQKRGISAIGLDSSPHMISYAKTKYSYDFINGNALNMSLFPSDSFTHILCLYFTIYYMKYKEQFFQNAYHWLMPGGYLAVHLSKKWAYGPSSFKGPFTYTSTHTPFTHYELITQGKKQKRIDHKIFMESINSIVGVAKQVGFTVHSVYEYKVPYPDQYLYVFLK
jgi:ubiquinone/menaquinone biosynthesis C-methylase UbiE